MKNYVFIDLVDTQLIKMRDACAGILLVLCEITPFNKDDIQEGTKIVLTRYDELLFLMQVWKVDRKFASEFSVEGYNITENLKGKRKLEEFWREISSDPTLTEEFIEEHKDQLNWYELSHKYPMSEEFMEKYLGKLNWQAVCWYQNLSESFVEKHEDRIIWYALHHSQKFSEEFIEKHRRKLENVIWERKK